MRGVPGHKTTLVLLPGMDGTGELFSDFVSAIGPDAKCVVIAYPVDGALGYAELQAFIRKSLPAEEPFVLLAESFSGPLGVSIAADPPKNLIALILVCSFARSPRRLPASMHASVSALPLWKLPIAIISRLLLGEHWSPTLASRLQSAIERVTPRAWRARLRAVLAVDVTADLAKITVPLLCLIARRDVLVPRTASAHIKNHARSAKLVDIDGSHFLLQANPVESARAVNAYLNEIGARRFTQSDPSRPTSQRLL